MKKFEVTIVSGEGVTRTVEQEADGFRYDPDSGVFAQRGTAVFYEVRPVQAGTSYQYADQDNIAVYRGVTEIKPILPKVASNEPTGSVSNI